MNSIKTPESDAYRKEVDKFKDSLLTHIPDQLGERLEQLTRKGVTEGPEITALNELLASENIKEKEARKIRGKLRKWDTDWPKNLQ